jgi:hypothetical protein
LIFRKRRLLISLSRNQTSEKQTSGNAKNNLLGEISLEVTQNESHIDGTLILIYLLVGLVAVLIITWCVLVSLRSARAYRVNPNVAQN